MYHVTNRSEAHSLIQGAADVKTKVSSSAFSNEEIKNIFSEDLPIYKNILISDLKNLDNCISAQRSDWYIIRYPQNLQAHSPDS